MKTSLPLFILLLLCATAFGQVKFEKGYYITSQGDSVQSYIKNEDWARNPEFIEVKGSPESSTSEKLTIQQLKRFQIDNSDLYETFSVDVDMSPLDLNQLVEGASPLIVRDTVMLRAVVKGPVNLFVYLDQSSKTHFYVSKGSEEPRELLYQKIKRVVDYKATYQTLPIYKGMLAAYLTDCNEVKPRIEKTEFKQSQLRDLVLAYNICVNPSYVIAAEEKESSHIQLGFVGGAATVSYDFKSAQYFKDLVNADFKGSGVTGGLAVNYVLPRAHGKWVIANEVMYKQYVADGYYSTSSSNTSVKYDTKFKLSYLGLNNLLRYSFATGETRPFINIGVANNLLITDNSLQKTEKDYFGTVRYDEDKPLDEMRKHEQALLFGAGVTKGKYTVEVRTERGNGFSVYSDLKSIKSSYILQFTYLIR